MPSTKRAAAPAGGLLLFLRLCIALALAMISVPLLLASSASAVEDPNQVVVCKYSHTPETGELAQTVIIVDTSSLEDEGFAGEFPFNFSDEHNSSIAVRFAQVEENTGDLDKDVECEPFPGPTDECPELPGDQAEGFQCEPLTETETRDLGPLLDCDAGTITTLHQERTRTQTFNAETQLWEWGAFSDWETVDTTVEDATEVDCPVDNPPDPIVDPPPAPPAPPAPPETPTLPATGSSPYLTALGLMGALILAAGSTLFMRSRKVRVPKA